MSISPLQIGTNGESVAATLKASSRGTTSLLRFAQISFFLGARLAFGAFLLVTAVFCLLLYVPFSYFGFIHNPLMGWIPVFVRIHELLYGVLLIAVGLTLVPDLRRKETRRAAAAFLLLNASLCVHAWRRNDLANLGLDLGSYLWSMLSLFPLIWLAALDVTGAAEKHWPPPGKRSDTGLTGSIMAAAIVSVVFGASAAFRGTLPERIWSVSTLRGWSASLCFHLVIFTAVGLLLYLIGWVSSRTQHREQVKLILSGLLAWLLCCQALRTLILPTISFEGVEATIFAGVVAFAIVIYVTGLILQWRAFMARNNGSHAKPATRAILGGLFALVLCGAAYGIPVLLGQTDWDFVLQRVAVIGVWIFAFCVVCWMGPAKRKRSIQIPAFLIMGCAWVGFGNYAWSALYKPVPEGVWPGVLGSYAGSDISFKTAYDILSRPVDNKAYRQFYEFLKQNTNLGRSVAVPPADVRLVSDLRPTPGTKPNIFVFVIDSLRQDYISPYNAAVDYTPEIGHFAQDSVVFRNAFTRYGGTALSEPSIWVGAMQLHKQYIAPFYPMNNLQKLLDIDGYQSYISIDPILREVLRKSASITELDQGTKIWNNLDLVPTLKELETKIDTRPISSNPIFAYTQPQNVHTLTRERSKIKGGRRAISIYELRRMDTAFGEFIRFLQQRGLYDNSIIILTADHGESYGEFGRWGHADFLFPEVIRVPIIMHLPPRMRDSVVWDDRQVTFLTDLTPSLYYLLGHGPVINNELFGRPLFTQTMQEQSKYKRPQYMIVSSYAPVYAILGGDAQSEFIVDAVNGRNYYYNLVEDPLGTHNHVTIKLANENEVLVRREVSRIATFYGLHRSQNGQ